MSIISVEDILDIVKSSDISLSYEDIIDKVPNSYGHIDEIYRCILELENKGLIEKVNGNYRYSKKAKEQDVIKQNRENFQIQKEQLEFEKNQIEKELNSRNLKYFKKTNIKSNLAIGISLCVLVIEIIKIFLPNN
jgi:hypothetical protein